MLRPSLAQITQSKTTSWHWRPNWMEPQVMGALYVELLYDKINERHSRMCRWFSVPLSWSHTPVNQSSSLPQIIDIDLIKGEVAAAGK